MGDEKIWEKAKQKIIRNRNSKNLNFDDHVISLCKKTSSVIQIIFSVYEFQTKVNPSEDIC